MNTRVQPMAPPARVLLVDDDPLMHELVQHFLAGLPIAFDHAYSGEQALQAATTTLPTLVLLDVGMPGLDGFETCRRLRREAAAGDVPVVFITASVDTDDIVRAFEVGGSDYVRKPIEPAELRARVNSHVQLAQARQRELARLRDNEKLAQLGEMVGAMSHEIATPIGNAKLAVDLLSGALRDLRQSRKQGHLTASGLEAFFDRGDEAVAIAERALGFAGQLLTSFKTVAVDQCADRRQRVRVHDYLQQILLSQRAKLRAGQVEVVVEGAADIEIETDPGALAQIIGNLINNSLIHGFEGRQGGRIDIAFALDADALCLSYRDNGKGMADDVRRRVFDAYFTTRAGQGGSGLGMHIVHDLVCQRLAGSIACDSAPGQGVRFAFRLPRGTFGVS